MSDDPAFSFSQAICQCEFFLVQEIWTNKNTVRVTEMLQCYWLEVSAVFVYCNLLQLLLNCNLRHLVLVSWMVMYATSIQISCKRTSFSHEKTGQSDTSFTSQLLWSITLKQERLQHWVPTLLVKKHSRTFQAPKSIFPGRLRKPAMFKYSKKQQLRSLREHCKLCQWGPGRNSGRESIFGIPAAQKAYLTATIIAIFVCIKMSI